MLKPKHSRVFFTGRGVSIDQDGRDNEAIGKDVYNTTSIGKPLQCYDHYYVGYIDELVFWEKVLTLEEVEDVFTTTGNYMCSED